MITRNSSLSSDDPRESLASDPITDDATNAITDDEIRALLRASLHDEVAYWTCRAALDESVGRCTPWLIRSSRARCAVLINARSTK